LHKRAQQAGLLFLAAAGSLAAAAACDYRSMKWQLAYVSNSSEWNEVDASGRKLDRESGVLSGPEVAASLRCEDWNFQAQASQLDGTRAYDGQTSTGVPVMSQSAIRQLQGHLQAGYKLAESWQLGARLSGQTLWRDIASAGGATGYPERYDWSMLSVGGQWQTTAGPGQLNLAAWVGQALWSRMELNLPGYDPAILPLGNISQFELAIGWQTEFSPSWQFIAGLRYRRTDMSQGADVVLRRSGNPVGVAHQPATSMVDMPLSVGIAYQF
jgi:hypothetical protein